MSPFTSRWRRAFTRTRHGAPHDCLTPTAVAVGLVLSEYADWDTGTGARPGLERIATVVGTSPKTVVRAVQALVAAEWLEREERGTFGRATSYRLTIPSLVHLGTGEVSAPTKGSDQDVVERPRNGVTGVPVALTVTGSLVSSLRRRASTRNGVTGVHVTGSLVSHHLCHDLYVGGALGGAA